MTNNVTMTVKGNKLTIEVDLTKTYGKSSTGKSTIIASTGKAEVEGHTGVFVNLNIYK